jgi:hypothetical protein
MASNKVYSVKCQYCGEEFEARSSRAKNCSDCNALMADANKRQGAYAAAQEASRDAMTIDTTPAERREMISAAINEGSKAFTRRIIEYRERAAQRKADRITEQNKRQAFFQQHGYFPNSYVSPDNIENDVIGEASNPNSDEYIDM